MAGFNDRSGSNFSQYINDLSVGPQAYNQDFLGDDFSADPDLALFTNTDFTEFEPLGTLPDGGLGYDLNEKKPPDSDVKYDDLIPSATSPRINMQPGTNFYAGYPTNIQPAPPSTVPSNAAYQSPIGPPLLSPDPNNQAIAPHQPDSLSSPPDQQSRVAAEEDKRRRNTAASARFRVKKKQREQALEKTVREVSDKNTALEAKITQLETENKWLKDLITEKNGQQQTKEEIAEAYQKFRRESEERDTEQKVGTTAAGRTRS